MKPIPRRPLIPILTDLLEYRQAANNTIPYTRKMMDKYGDVCEVSFTGVKNYFIHDPELIKEILTSQGPKMKRTYLFRAFRKFLGHGLFTSDGNYHRQQRQLIKPAFYPQRIEEYTSIMVSCADEETKNWKAGDTINVNQAMTRITLNVICRAMFGSGMSSTEIEKVGKDLESAFRLMNRIIQNPFYVYCLEKEIRVPLIRSFFKLKAELDGVINGFIASYRKDDRIKRTDLLSMLMEARDEETGKGMTDIQIRDELVTFFIAGHETTSLALTWTWYLIGQHPEIAGRFYEEIKGKIPSGVPKASDYENLHLTKNIFRESLRLYPPAWTFARETKEDVVIQDYHFPKGACLWTITYLVHHNAKYFPEPEKFIPGRWDEESIKKLPKYAYFPFGGGSRMCIGEGFAWMEGVLVLATIAGRFQLTTADNSSIDINPLFTLKPKKALMMKVQ